MVLKANKKSIFTIYLISNLFLLIIPAIVLSLTIYVVSSSSKAALEDSSEQIGTQYQLAMDNNFRELDEIYTALFQETSVKHFLYQDENMSDYDHYMAVQIMERLAALNSSTIFLDNMYLYFPANDSIVTPSYRLDSRTFYERMYQYSGMTYHQWLTFLQNGFQTHRLIQKDLIDMNNPENKTLTFARTLYITSDQKYNPVLVFFVSEEKLEQLAHNLLVPAGMCAEIIDENGNYVFTSQENRTEEPSILLDSNVTDWQYKIYMGRTLGQPFYSAFRFIALSAGVGLLLDLLMAALLAYTNYVPIRGMAQKFNKSSEGNLEKAHSNELWQIESILEHTLAQSKENRNRLKEMEPVYINHYLNKLLNGQELVPSVVEETLKEYNISLVSERFAIIDIVVCQTTSFNYDGSEKERGLVHMLIKNVADELFENLASVQYVYHSEEKTVTAVLNLYEGCGSNHILECARSIQTVFQQRLHIQLSLFISEITHGIQSLPLAYSQAEYTMRFGRREKCGVTEYKNILFDGMGVSSYTSDDEIQLINLVRSGDEKRVAAKLQQLFTENMDTQYRTPANGEFFLIHLFSTFLKIAHQINYNLERETIEPATFFANSQEKQERCSRLVEIYQKLTRYAADKNGRINRIMDQIADLTEKYYHDGNLSVSFLAGQVGLTPSYLSTVFKNQSAENLSDYINLVRIQHAKEFLTNTDFTMAEIASRCGYHSDINFIRVFKKYEGITPGVYRNNRT